MKFPPFSHAVNQWSLAPIQGQQGSPLWGVVKKETLFSTYSSLIMQHSCETSMVVGQSWAQPPQASSVPLCSGLCWSVPPLLCSGEVPSISAQPGKCNIRWKGNVHSQNQRGPGLRLRKDPKTGIISWGSGTLVVQASLLGECSRNPSVLVHQLALL